MELINNGDAYEISSSSSFEIVDLLFSQGLMDSIEKTEKIKDFYKSIHSITSIDLLLVFQNAFPINKNQRRTLKKYIENQYKSISTITDIYSLTQYLENSDIARYINQEYYNEVRGKFLELIEGVDDISVANVFYQAMLFLLAVNRNNQIVDKRIVKQDMIILQEFWQKSVYQVQTDNLREFTFNTKVPTEEIEKYNK